MVAWSCMGEIRTILFDLDGTIIDTEPAAAKAIALRFKSWGIEVDPQDATYVTGRTWASAFSFLFGKYKLPIPQDEAISQIMNEYRETLERELPVVPGSADAVRALAPHFDLGLVSGSGRTEILWALKKLGIDQHFKVILGAEDYPQSKPEPDGYLKALKLLKGDARRSLVFEDSQAGITSGRRAGAWVVAITGTNHFDQDTASAHHFIEDLRGVDREWVLTVSRSFK